MSDAEGDAEVRGALLALGMAGAFRRSELVALRVEDVLVVPEDLRVLVRRSKTDQEGAGATVANPDGRWLQPEVLLARWVAEAGLADGFLFRRLTKGNALTDDPMPDRAVARLVQARARAAGYDPQRVQDARGQPAQEHAGARRLRSRRRAVPKPRGKRVPVATRRRLYGARHVVVGQHRARWQASLPSPIRAEGSMMLTSSLSATHASGTPQQRPRLCPTCGHQAPKLVVPLQPQCSLEGSR